MVNGNKYTTLRMGSTLLGQLLWRAIIILKGTREYILPKLKKRWERMWREHLVSSKHDLPWWGVQLDFGIRTLYGT
jgi:hypothetical protein